VRIAGAQTERGEFAVFTRQGWQKDQMVVVVHEGDREMTKRVETDSVWASVFRLELLHMGVEVRDYLA
jgi:hypothetical protein